MKERTYMIAAIIVALALLAAILLGARAGVLTQTVTQTQTLTQPVTITQTRTETMTQTQTITQTQVLTTTQTITHTRDTGITYIVEPIGLILYEEQYWEYYYKVKVASLSTITIVLRSSDGPMKVKIDINDKTLYYDDKTYSVNFKHNLEPGEHTIFVRIENPEPRPPISLFRFKITVEGELKIESIG